MVPPDSGSCLNPSAPVRISQSHCSCSCSYSLCAQICLLRWGKKDGAINVSFKRRIVLPCALFQFPSVSFAKTLLPWNSRRSFFFQHHFLFLSQFFRCSLHSDTSVVFFTLLTVHKVNASKKFKGSLISACVWERERGLLVHTCP